MSRITIDEVKKLYELSRLPLEEGKIAARQKDMDEILEYVASLGRLDTSTAKEVHGGSEGLNGFRTDALGGSTDADRERVVKSFPTNEANLNKVPNVMGK